MTQFNETLLKRLVYQSTHRGCKELDILLGNFASIEALSILTQEQITSYENLLNENDWEIYDWIISSKPTPSQYESIIQKIQSTTPTSEVTAGFLIIGNEILSGKTQDANLCHLALELQKIGIRVKETRIVMDIEQEIINALKALSCKYTYVFTSGGIGPTHDDITTESVAKAFNKNLVLNEQAYSDIEAFYKARGDQMNEARKKMAIVPEDSRLITNAVSGAPGFVINNVYVLAGVPRIFSSCLSIVVKELKHGQIFYSQSVNLSISESKIAEGLTSIQNSFKLLEIGSYPKEGGVTQIVISGYDKTLIESCKEQVLKLTP